MSLTPHERELWVNRAVADSLPMRLFSDGVFNGPRLRMETWLHEAWKMGLEEGEAKCRASHPKPPPPPVPDDDDEE